jgi:hypothetical protein
MIRYIDDFVMCFQYREDALRVQDALCKRLGKFGLTPEPTKTKLVEFGRFAQQHAAKHGRKRPETIYFSGVHALLHAEPEGQLQDWTAHREISLAAQSHVVAGPAATNPELVGPGTGQRCQRRSEGPLRLLKGPVSRLLPMEDEDGRSKTRSSRRTGLQVTTLGYGEWNSAGLRAPVTSRRRKRRPFSTPTLDEQGALRGRGDPHGRRQPLRSRRLHLDSTISAAGCARRTRSNRAGSR